MKAIRLKTNYRKDPIGIDADRFHLTWNCEGGKKQESFRITVKDELQKPVFESEEIHSDVMYDDGHPLGHSMNHYSPGAVCAFLYDTVCGIRIEGKNRFVMQPVPGGTLSYAKAEYLSPYGKVSSSWEKKEGKTVFQFHIPCNCSARICLPDGRTEEVSAGDHRFTI